MKPQTRKGLVLGLVFILVFGMVLSELNETPNEGLAVEPPGSPLVGSPRKVDADRLGPSDRPGRWRTVRHERPDPRPTERGRLTVHGPDESASGRGVPAVIRWRRNPPAGSRTEAPAPQPGRPREPSRPAGKNYVVQNGDSLRGIAKKFYGEQNAHLYKRIFEANRDKLPDAATVFAGQTLLIPLDERRAPTGTRTGVREMDGRQLREHLGIRSTPARTRTYTVGAGDTLTEIARRTLGSGSPENVERLYRTNRSTLTDKDQLTVGVVLKIPG